LKFIMVDSTYSPKTYRKNNGDTFVVASGGALTVEAGGTLTVAGVTVDETTLAMTGLTATAVELNQYAVSLDIADASAEAVYYAVCPHAGDIAKIYTVTDGVVSTADITITAAIGAVAVTNGVVTIATAASAAGDVDVATPTAANTVTAGQAVNFTVTGGGAGGSPRVHLVMLVTR
jgi:hypothetical protein